MDTQVPISGPATTRAGPAAGARTLRFLIYRYDPDRDGRPRMQSYEIVCSRPTGCCWMR